MAAGDVDCRIAQVKGFQGIFTNGVDSYIDTNVDCPTFLRNKDFSINFWGFASSITTYLMSGQKGEAPYSSIFIFDVSGVGALFFYNTITVGVTTLIDDTKWHMLTMVRDNTAGTFEAFLDGVSIGTSAALGADPAILTSTMKFGVSGDGAFGFGKGGMRECSIYQKKLTTTEITELYNNLGMASNCYAYWKLQNNVLDYSGNGRNATIVGAGTYYGIVEKGITDLQAAVYDQRATYGSTYKQPMLVRGQRGQVISTFIDA